MFRIIQLKEFNFKYPNPKIFNYMTRIWKVNTVLLTQNSWIVLHGSGLYEKVQSRQNWQFVYVEF